MIFRFEPLIFRGVIPSTEGLKRLKNDGDDGNYIFFLNSKMNIETILDLQDVRKFGVVSSLYKS